MEKFLTKYLNKTMRKYELFLMEKDVVLLVSVKNYLNRKKQIEQDIWNYFGLNAHLNEIGRSYKFTILNVASKYFTAGKITQAHLEALYDQYDKYVAKDYKYFYNDV
jgi:hypothetical protein